MKIVLSCGIVLIAVVAIIIFSVANRKRQIQSFVNKIQTTPIPYQYWIDNYPPIWILFEETFPIANRGHAMNREWTSSTIHNNSLWNMNNLYAYQWICLASIYKYNTNIRFLSYDNITTYLPDYDKQPQMDLNLQIDLIKYTLLARHGGIWLSSWTLVFDDLGDHMKQLPEHYALSVGLQGTYPAPNCTNWMTYPNNELMVFMSQRLQELKTNFSATSNYKFENIPSQLVVEWINQKNAQERYKNCMVDENNPIQIPYVILDNEYNGTYDIKYDHQQQRIVFLSPKDIRTHNDFIQIPNRDNTGVVQLDDLFMTDNENNPFEPPTNWIWFQFDYEWLLQRLNMKWFLATDVLHIITAQYRLAKLARFALQVQSAIQYDPVPYKHLIQLWNIENVNPWAF